MRAAAVLPLLLAFAPAARAGDAAPHQGAARLIRTALNGTLYDLEDLSGVRDPGTGGVYLYRFVCGGLHPTTLPLQFGQIYQVRLDVRGSIRLIGVDDSGCIPIAFSCNAPNAHWSVVNNDSTCQLDGAPPAPAPAVAPPAPAPAAPPPAAQGLSRDEVQAMVDAAARKAAQQTAAKAEKAPAAPDSDGFSSDVDKPSYQESARPHDVALIVGVEKYDDLPAADFAERDAAAVRAHALALGYAPRNVIVLTGHAASRAGLVKNLEKRLPELVKPDSTVLFYYSGHGAPDPATGKAYLVPVDGDPAFLEETGYPLPRLYQKLGALKAKRVVVALDACFSGAGGRSVLAKGTRPLVTRIDEGAVPAKVISITASSATQIAGALKDQRHGAFTYYFLKGLSGGRRTTRDLYDYLKPQVEDSARTDNRDQSPTMTGADEPLR